jgi:hypothetical protein
MIRRRVPGLLLLRFPDLLLFCQLLSQLFCSSTKANFFCHGIIRADFRFIKGSLTGNGRFSSTLIQNLVWRTLDINDFNPKKITEEAGRNGLLAEGMKAVAQAGTEI